MTTVSGKTLQELIWHCGCGHVNIMSHRQCRLCKRGRQLNSIEPMSLLSVRRSLAIVEFCKLAFWIRRRQPDDREHWLA